MKDLRLMFTKTTQESELNEKNAARNEELYTMMFFKMFYRSSLIGDLL